MKASSLFELEARTTTGGDPVSPRMRVATLAAGATALELSLRGSKRLSNRVFNIGRARFSLSVPTQATARLSFSEDEDGARAKLQAEVETSVRWRVPARRRSHQALSVSGSGGGHALLELEFPLDARWTLARALRELTPWVDPQTWSSGIPLPVGATWSLEEEVPLQLGASARVQKLRLGPLPGISAMTVLGTRAELELRLARLDRVQVALRAEEPWQISASLQTLTRSSRRIGAKLGLGYHLQDAEGLGSELLDALWPAAGELLPNAERLLGKVQRLRKRFDEIPESLRRRRRALIGEGSRIDILITRLESLEAWLASAEPAGSDRRWLRRVREARKLAASIQDEGRALFSRLETLTGRVFAGRSLRAIARTLEQLLEAAQSLRDELPARAASVLAKGLAAELSAARLWTHENRLLATARLDPRMPAAGDAVAAFLAGQVPELAILGSADGVTQVAGTYIEEWRKTRTRTLRLRVGPREAYSQRRWLTRFRITESLDGAVDVLARERYSRKSSQLLRDEMTAMIIDLAITARDKGSDALLTLSWSRSYRGQRAAHRLEVALERLLESLTPPGESVDAPILAPRGEVSLVSVLDRAALRAALRPRQDARNFSERFFWPAWARAIETGYRQLPPPLLRAGRHPLRDPAVRRLLTRKPTAQALRQAFPRMKRLEREAVASDWLLGQAVLSGLETVRRAFDTQQSTRAFAAGARRVLRAFDSLPQVNLVPLLALTLLLPPSRRTLDWSLPRYSSGSRSSGSP